MANFHNTKSLKFFALHFYYTTCKKQKPQPLAVVATCFNPQRVGYKLRSERSREASINAFNPQREGYKPVDGLRNLTRNKWLSFQAAAGYFYYTPKAFESQGMPKTSFCSRPPGVFGGIAGRQQLVNTKSEI
ncbi:hypothetical protein [Caldicellulosiruptor danielii]|uniref:Uncharacterized protein n=1 Tax=Anaerocellum danielii TaxID=1387557 RepID=A0ABZ0TZX6_9FIRM|nr:hypothetical protein [Caldicellulosiruptor danielii]WPX08767.1 hypothetical protein SOJ16_002677 [Caldicellulosiruptor danielii]